jgi:hypothetical protein
MADQSIPEAYVVVVEHGRSASTFRVGAPRVVLGRAPDCDIILSNPRISRRHAELAWDGEKFTVTDLQSKNGTRLNGVPILAPARVSDGDTLELADCRLRFDAGAPTVTAIIAPLVAGISLNPATHDVRVRGEAVSLTPKEYGLLSLLFGRSGAVVTHREIAAEIWPELGGDASEDSIAQLVARLRRKLEATGAPRCLLTVRGFGYRLSPGGPDSDLET